MRNIVKRKCTLRRYYRDKTRPDKPSMTSKLFHKRKPDGIRDSVTENVWTDVNILEHIMDTKEFCLPLHVSCNLWVPVLPNIGQTTSAPPYVTDRHLLNAIGPIEKPNDSTWWNKRDRLGQISKLKYGRVHFYVFAFPNFISSDDRTRNKRNIFGR